MVKGDFVKPKTNKLTHSLKGNSEKLFGSLLMMLESSNKKWRLALIFEGSYPIGEQSLGVVRGQRQRT
ncbi:hypothetical protein KY290_014837 [Solanum tuberosum]|uniref:Uncharacterized protein n=1 Tax=Solanum tuberosum TaxID=4113 RepID=A0ABQ7VQR0_SOLTU|nr:hypothetical protein KY290_014837 [Solanum tuberosum]